MLQTQRGKSDNNAKINIFILLPHITYNKKTEHNRKTVKTNSLRRLLTKQIELALGEGGLNKSGESVFFPDLRVHTLQNVRDVY